MSPSTDNRDKTPRAIEVGFPIVDINRLAQPERSSFKPIYQIHKWFARRASCVFRAILLGALKPALKADGTRVDIMEEFYRSHTDDPDTAGKVVLDPFMGGGTPVVEALRLGCQVVGIDLNPVAWFMVKTALEPVDEDALQVSCPACGHDYDPRSGNVPVKGTFECACGNRDKVIESIRLLPQARRFPVRPNAVQSCLKPRKSSCERIPRESLFEDVVAEDAATYFNLS